MSALRKWYPCISRPVGIISGSRIIGGGALVCVAFLELHRPQVSHPADCRDKPMYLSLCIIHIAQMMSILEMASIFPMTHSASARCQTRLQDGFSFVQRCILMRRYLKYTTRFVVVNPSFVVTLTRYIPDAIDSFGVQM